MGMDRRDLVEGLQKAFNGDDRERSTNDVADVEYRANTNTLLVNEHKTFSMEDEQPDKPIMSEEELFGRLLKERRNS